MSKSSHLERPSDKPNKETRDQAASESLGDLAYELFGADHGVELEVSPNPPHEAIDLDP